LGALRIGDAEFERLAQAEMAELERRVIAYRGDRALPRPEQRDVVVVDDGLATGVTAEAALLAARGLGATRVVLAVPVCAPDTARRLESLADLVVCTSRPDDFSAVGRWYDRFDQTSDVEVLELLARAQAGRAEAPR
jgi:putative phosphoribosyl transferase